jgi:bacillithiol biosynthesis cysteine-adding enzyme BshC
MPIQRTRDHELTVQSLPISAIPGLHRIFLDYCTAQNAGFRGWYGAAPADRGWQQSQHPQTAEHREAVASLLEAQNPGSSLAGLRQGANLVVTGQQVGLFGGPAFTPFKAATAIALAREVTAAGHAHLPVFWLASEDHDFAEINHVTFPKRREMRKLSYASVPSTAVPVGGVVLDETITPLLDEAWELLGYSDAMEWLSAAYRPGQTMAGAFAEFYRNVFSAHGLLVLDASGREAHRLGAPVLQTALERADELHSALVERNREIVAAGYHAQVTVPARASLLFLLDTESGARVALRRTEASAAEPAGSWHAGRKSYSTADLLGILAAEPERISPSALLRPVFQDQILPTSAYVGGPAEIAYFAQSAVLYEQILGRLTPILPRLSATLVEPAIGELLQRHDLSIETVFACSQQELAQRLAARAMPVAGKQLLASAGNALDAELTSLTGYMTGLDEGLGRSAATSASKMRYQMNRMRRLAANFELKREESLGRHAQAVSNALYPHGGLQERLIGAAFFLARYGDGLVETLLGVAADGPGHKVIHL